ncbi:S-adenosyl-L-methionine-dependent methyltransferase [Melampsora americana]|nr:S-adenosyl-L-methionine-dependent methyltransferase [Melampsora americana]
MAFTFSDESYSIESYHTYRPRYPQELYQSIINYHQADLQLALDLGCGTGIVTTDLLRLGEFQRVIGIDPSEPMIDYAKKSHQDPRLDFRQGRAEKLDGIESASVDMLVAGTSAHWFSSDWWDEAARVLKPKGTVAVFVYGGMWPDPDHPKANELRSTMFSFEKELGNWTTGNTISHNMYDDLPLPQKSNEFNSIERIQWNREGKGKRLIMFDRLTIPNFRKRVYTFGVAHRWKVENPKKVGSLDEDPIERVIEKN